MPLKNPLRPLRNPSWLRVTIYLCLINATLGGAFAKTTSIPCSLDALITTPQCWKMTPERCEKIFTHNNVKLYEWLTKNKTRLKISRQYFSNVEIDLRIFENKVRVEEVIADFNQGHLNLVTFSIYNRGDTKNIDRKQFKELYIQCGKALNAQLKTHPSIIKSNKRQGLLTAGYSWNAPHSIALLEHNDGALKSKQLEFLRLRMAKKGAKGGLAASMLNKRGGASIRLSSLKNFVVKDEKGNVYIKNLPMVDQGKKGYCVVASVQRIFEYFGIGADMHQIAAIAQADPTKGTSTLSMAKELNKIDYRFKTRLKIIAMMSDNGLTDVEIKKGQYYVGKPIGIRKITARIQKSINAGIPLLWSLRLGVVPENPPLSKQANGGHMRLIIGYNEKENTLIFSDSWGAGHEFKTMLLKDAYRVTKGLFSLTPTLH